MQILIAALVLMNAQQEFTCGYVVERNDRQGFRVVANWSTDWTTNNNNADPWRVGPNPSVWQHDWGGTFGTSTSHTFAVD